LHFQHFAGRSLAASARPIDFFERRALRLAVY